jgi:hypothetical protein
MKDATHHIRYLQRKVVQASRKAKANEETTPERNSEVAINQSEAFNFERKKR